MNRESIIKHFTDNIKAYKQYAKNIGGAQDAEDLFQECSLMLLEFSEDRLIAAWNSVHGLKPFFLRVLSLQYRSKTSYFHKKYRKQEQFLHKKGADIAYNEQVYDVEDLDANEIHQAVNLVTDNQLENLVWDLYVETGSLRRTLAGIPPEYSQYFTLKLVNAIVNKFQRSIKQKLNTEK